MGQHAPLRGAWNAVSSAPIPPAKAPCSVWRCFPFSLGEPLSSQEPKVCRLFPGGRWIRTSGTAAEKPWISAAFRALRGYRRNSWTIPPDGSAFLLLRLAPREPLHRARLGHVLSRLWLAALRGGFRLLAVQLIYSFASSRKISRPAFATVGSSSVPTFRIIMPGRVPGSSAIDDPHSGQKCLRIGLPLPPMLLNVLYVPSMVSASLVIRTSTAKALPVTFGNPGNGTLLRLSGRPRLCSALSRRGNHL